MLIEPQLKKVEKYFINRKRIQAKVDELKAERVAKGSHEGGGGSGISDPTASEAMKNVEPIKFITLDEGAYEEVIYQPIEWLEVVSETYTAHKEQLAGAAMAYRYEICKKPDVIYGLLGIGKQLYYNLRAEFLQDAVLLAVEKGLLGLEK